jgi:hypothetical protein
MLMLIVVCNVVVRLHGKVGRKVCQLAHAVIHSRLICYCGRAIFHNNMKVSSKIYPYTV